MPHFSKRMFCFPHSLLRSEKAQVEFVTFQQSHCFKTLQDFSRHIRTGSYDTCKELCHGNFNRIGLCALRRLFLSMPFPLEAFKSKSQAVVRSQFEWTQTQLDAHQKSLYHDAKNFETHCSPSYLDGTFYDHPTH